MPQIIHTIDELRSVITPLKAQGKRIGLVPTMGALHEGHLSLIDIMRKESDILVASIFVNPMQFSANEDLDKYPKRLEADKEKLTQHHTDIIYIPSVEQMYPQGFSSSINVNDVSHGLCGDTRPHHFQGVATIVGKLFNQVQPDIACFGEKDYQQLCVIRKMVQDLNFPVRIIAGQTVREESGLAMSSRNQYLNDEEKEIAPQLYAALCETAKTLRSGKSVMESMTIGSLMLDDAGFDRVEYLELRDPNTLSPLENMVKGARLLAAVRIGATRLIDNIEVDLQS